MAGVSGIIARLDNPTFFPKTTPEKIAEVAGDELNSLHGDLAPALIAKLYAEIVDATKSKTIRSNALLLVCGLAMRAGSAREAVWRNIDRVAENAGFALEALKIVCADPQGIALARPLVRERLISLIRRNMKDAGARRAVHKLTVSNQLTGVERDEIAVALASLDASDEQLVKFTTEAALVEAETLIFRRIVDHCRDHSFATANKAIDLLQELDDDVANRFSQELKVDYLINLGYNAGRTYPATSAAAIVKNGLDVRSGFADALLEEARLRPDRLRAANTEWEKIAKLCEHSNRHDVLLPLIEVFSASEPDDAAQKMTFYLKSNSQPEIANAASAEHARIIDSML